MSSACPLCATNTRPLRGASLLFENAVSGGRPDSLRDGAAIMRHRVVRRRTPIHLVQIELHGGQVCRGLTNRCDGPAGICGKLIALWLLTAVG